MAAALGAVGGCTAGETIDGAVAAAAARAICVLAAVAVVGMGVDAAAAVAVDAVEIGGAVAGMSYFCT